MKGFRKMPIEKEIIEQIERGKLSFPPLSICLLQAIKESRRADALIEVSWGEKKAEFAVEFKSISSLTTCCSWVRPRFCRNGRNPVPRMTSTCFSVRNCSLNQQN
jgi:hypothetical protein